MSPILMTLMTIASAQKVLHIGGFFALSGTRWNGGHRTQAPILLAIDLINNNSEILPNYTISLIWNDTMLKEACSAKLKTDRQYYILGWYEILQCGDVEKLIRKRAKLTEEPIYFVNIDDMNDIVKRAHISNGHGGRHKMVIFWSRYANIMRESTELFKSLCIECQKKRKRATTKGVVVRPILSKDFGSRGQVDLIDMQSMTKAPYKWIIVYQNHLTKCCVLCPLTSERAAEVAFRLMDIFLLLGAPQILQSDNGSEFTASVITELKVLWPDLLMVHGKPRHPHSQGSVEGLNCDVKDRLIAWLGDNNSTDWSVGLRFVQFQKNCSYHSGIKQTSYKALFGTDARIRLRTCALSADILERMASEEDLGEIILKSQDVAPAHISMVTVVALRHCGFQLFDQPSYSSDLAPLDFHKFDN
ncbi:KRAB-A domain-containing protein 2-like [Gigantopelta aegis]|uniref:KRAB-A domain-containing protein 2-like n=1 Tax=Gigantopelta aegis TaxID=1735272 RepID=UPI001B88B37A|nr:KRAB-A domain-containing protein 2-like [Gigantopelta aegis]